MNADSDGKRILSCTVLTLASNLPSVSGLRSLVFLWNASVVPLGFGHRHRVSARVQNMRYEACMQEGDRKVSANSLGNSFRNTYADYGVVRKRMSFGYPLDEDGNYPEGWY